MLQLTWGSDRTIKPLLQAMLLDDDLPPDLTAKQYEQAANIASDVEERLSRLQNMLEDDKSVVPGGPAEAEIQGIIVDCKAYLDIARQGTAPVDPAEDSITYTRQGWGR